MSLLLLLRSLRGGVSFLLRDDFATDEEAPLTSPRTAEPGPGEWTIVDNGENLDIANGVLVASGQVGSSDPRVYGDALARVTGRALIADMQANGTGYGRVGWSSANTSQDGEASCGVFPTSSFFVWDGSLSAATVGMTGATGTWYRVAVILRTTGAFYLTATPGSSTFTLRWVGVAGSTTPVYPMWNTQVSSANPALDNVGVITLSGVWSEDYGIATARLAGERAEDDAFTHRSNCLIEFEVDDLTTTDEMRVRFRQQDADNYWEVEIASDGDLVLNEVVAGEATSRGSSAAVVASGDRIVIVCDGSTITVHEANTQRISYTSATNFQTATSGTVAALGDGAVVDLISWPRTVVLPKGVS